MVEEELHHFTESGLSYIYLEGCRRYDCTDGKCDGSEVAIPNLVGLMRTIAETVARQGRKLLPTEIRFLRTYLGFSGADFARRIGVSPETVSRWERGSVRMKNSTERFLRVLVLSKDGPFRDYDALERFAEKKGKRASQKKFIFSEDQWDEEQAA